MRKAQPPRPPKGGGCVFKTKNNAVTGTTSMQNPHVVLTLVLRYWLSIVIEERLPRTTTKPKERIKRLNDNHLKNKSRRHLTTTPTRPATMTHSATRSSAAENTTRANFKHVPSLSNDHLSARPCRQFPTLRRRESFATVQHNNSVATKKIKKHSHGHPASHSIPPRAINASLYPHLKPLTETF